MQITTELIESLLYEEEGTALDFKREQYPFAGASKEDKSELLKHILAFANAFRRSDGFILVGVEEVKGGKSNVLGVSTQLDDADLQQFVNTKTQRPVTFSYRAMDIEGTPIGVIHIPQQYRPIHLTKSYGKLAKGTVYLRRGSSTGEATPDEIAQMGAERAVVHPTQPALELQLFDRTTGQQLGHEASASTSLLTIPSKEDIPLYRETSAMMSGFSHENRDYYRELADFTRIKPYHPSATGRIKAFLDLDRFHGHSDAQNGELVIELTEPRGRIDLAEDNLAIEGSEDLYLTGQINDDAPLALRPGQSHPIARKEIRDLELWLLGKDDEIIDYRSTTEWPHQFQVTEGAAERTDQLKATINKGESESCEFKQFIDLDDKTKRRDLQKTVCAFSNSNGGMLFIGVDDEGEVSGLEQGLRSNSQTPGQYEKAISKHLQEHLRFGNCFSIEQAKLYGNSVLCVTVTSAPETNTTQNPVQTYIRRGATNRQMEPDDIKNHRNANPFL